MSRYAMSRRRRTTIIVACVSLAAVLVWLDRTKISPQRQSTPAGLQQQSQRDFEKYDGRTFAIVNVVDGDTIDIDVPDGKYNHTRIRLWGVDTPETKSPKVAPMYFGKEASEFTTKTCIDKKVTIYLDKHKRTRGYYGRLLAYVRLPYGKFLNELLLSEGLAYADLRFRHSLYNKYKQLEAVARSQRKGLWENVTHEQLPGWLQKRKPKLMLGKKQ